MLYGLQERGHALNQVERKAFTGGTVYDRGMGIINPEVKFQQHRSVLRVNERVAWRIPLLVLVVSKFRGQRASVADLHLMIWAMKSAVTRALIFAWWEARQPADLATIRTDPHLEVTLKLAAAEDLIAIGRRNGKVELTERGKEFAALIDSDQELMSLEKDLLRKLTPLNESSILSHMGGASIDD
jgi:hypothetical protein